jgi:hypothetical protein
VLAERFPGVEKRRRAVALSGVEERRGIRLSGGELQCIVLIILRNCYIYN